MKELYVFPKIYAEGVLHTCKLQSNEETIDLNYLGDSDG